MYIFCNFCCSLASLLACFCSADNRGLPLLLLTGAVSFSATEATGCCRKVTLKVKLKGKQCEQA